MWSYLACTGGWWGWLAAAARSRRIARPGVGVVGGGGEKQGRHQPGAGVAPNTQPLNSRSVRLSKRREGVGGERGMTVQRPTQDRLSGSACSFAQSRAGGEQPLSDERSVTTLPPMIRPAKPVVGRGGVDAGNSYHP